MDAINKPQFGDVMLQDGTFVKPVAGMEKVRGIYLVSGYMMVGYSPKRKTFYKARNWSHIQGGEIPPVHVLAFIYQNFDELNGIRNLIGLDNLPKDTCWSCEVVVRSKKSEIGPHINAVMNLKDGSVSLLVSESVLIDDCGTSYAIAVAKID